MRFHGLLQYLNTDTALPEPAHLAGRDPDDWAAFTDQVIRLGLAHPVYQRLRLPQRRDLVPASCLQRLRDALRLALVSNLRQQAMLGRVLGACDNAGIAVILFKGLWLAETVYRDLKARPASDIDLLFRPQDLPRFTRVARELGFKIPAGVSDLRTIAPTTHELSLSHGSHRTCLDIHWALTHPSQGTAIDEETLWQRAEWVTLAGRPCRTLRPEDHLLYLCFHAAVHHRFLDLGPRAWLDLARLIDTPPRPLDWDAVVARAHALGWSRCVWLLLDLVREHLGVQPPHTVLAALRPADAHDQVIRVAVLAALLQSQRPAVSLAPNLVRLATEASTRKRAAMLWTRLFPPRAELATYFRTTANDPALSGLYLRRLALLLRQQGPAFGQLLLGQRSRAAEVEQARIIARWLG